MKYITTIAALSLLSSAAFAADTKHTLKLGYAYAMYNNSSSLLTNAPVPITGGAKDHGVIAMNYDYALTPNWSINLAGGLPPTVKLEALGEEVGESKALYPAVMGIYNYSLNNSTTLYAGAGVVYTKFVDPEVYDNYTEDFMGESSSADIEDDIGLTLKAGVTLHLNDRWLIDVNYARYGITADAAITTTHADGSSITREISVDVNPDIVTLSVGYKF
ncbi:OmpW/AlkL family protein [Aestuariibacter salexigens]|uniref:OmpW/AlkL family protein n=1 Tax=Aestuariibacter salexigens TaxID=226010 RepID=UPI0004234CFE|nr:OmpW family outer membrane protein [Aestuariibacter salexigens]